jgi:hypothetical protein
MCARCGTRSCTGSVAGYAARAGCVSRAARPTCRPLMSRSRTVALWFYAVSYFQTQAVSQMTNTNVIVSSCDQNSRELTLL